MSVLVFLFSAVTSASAWENHQIIMERLMDARVAKQRLYPYQKISVPCIEKEQKEIAQLGRDLKIDEKKIPLFSKKDCLSAPNGEEVFISDLIASSIVDEPDQGMDQNLPDEMDETHARKWMGGTTGPTSQGFRHMYFPGLQLSSVLTTLQIPMTATGDALKRIALLRNASDAYFKKGDKFWGLRTLLWEIHYIQDLQQPFHVVQIPSLKMLPWSHLLWGFVSSSTHAIANYHFAYEALVQGLYKEALSNGFQKCFEPEVLDDPTAPLELFEMPRNEAKKLGAAVYDIFGDRLKSKEVDLPAGINQIDSFAILHASEVSLPPEEDQKQLSHEETQNLKVQIKQFKALGELKKVTCDLTASVSRNTWKELDRAFVKQVQNSNSSKSGKWSDALPEIRRVRR